MNIYLLEQNVNADYDTYDSMVVSAPDEHTARQMHPNDPLGYNDQPRYKEWANSPDQVQVTLLGTSNNPTQKIILASYNAG
jgi:hypothetical protein